MSTEENKAIARRLIEETWNQGNLATVDELMAPAMLVTTLWFPTNHLAASSTSSTSSGRVPPSPISTPPLRNRSPKVIWL